MQRRSTILTIAALAAGLSTLGTTTSCRRGDDARYDSALNRDLNLVPTDSNVMIVSPEERSRLNAERARAASGNATTTSGRVYRSSGGEVARSTPAPAPSRVVKNTKRDAAIGAVAGAVIGGATHGAKGAVIGGATGGVVGAIIGNNVDKKKKKP